MSWPSFQANMEAFYRLLAVEIFMGTRWTFLASWRLFFKCSEGTVSSDTRLRCTKCGPAASETQAQTKTCRFSVFQISISLKRAGKQENNSHKCQLWVYLTSQNNAISENWIQFLHYFISQWETELNGGPCLFYKGTEMGSLLRLLTTVQVLSCFVHFPSVCIILIEL